MSDDNGAAVLLRSLESFARMSFRHLHDGHELGDGS